MTKLLYLAAMAFLGLGLTIAQNTSPATDSSNSSKPPQAQSGSAATSSNPAEQNAHPKGRHHSQQGVPDTTVQDQQGSTTSATDPSGQDRRRSSTSKMGTTGSTPEPESTAPQTDRRPQTERQSTPQNGTPTDQQPNSSSSPTTPPQMTMNQTPGARAMATHTPDPGTCMNPASLQAGSDPNGTVSTPHPPNCD